MSKKSVLGFIQQVLINPELHAQVERAGDYARLQEIASSAGFPFNEQEWNTASAEAFNGLLTEEDLEETTAGVNLPELSVKNFSSGMMGFAGKSGSLAEGQVLTRFVPNLGN